MHVLLFFIRSLDMLNTTQSKVRVRSSRQSSLLGSSSLPKRTGSGTNLQSLGQSYLQNKSSPKLSSKEGSSGKDRVSQH